MKLSFVFELLLIFVFLAFAASRVIDSKGHHLSRARKAVAHKHGKISHKKRQTDQNQPNRYCSCSAKLCNCCRDFNIPVVSLQGPGCASLQYLTGDKLAISMSFGDRVLTNTTISERRPRPICMPLPGGVSKFCGRVYNIRRQGEDFNACLGLELRALNDVEAALRVSCFKFGADGLKVQPAQPLPAVEEESDNDDDDDDDDDEDDYDDEDDFDFDDDEEDDDDEDDNDVEATEYESFSLLDDDFIDGLFVGEAESDGDEVTKKPVRPLRKVVSTKAPPKRKTVKPTNSQKPLRRRPSVSSTVKPKVTTTKKMVKETVTEKKPAFVPVSTISNDVKSESTTPVLQAVQMIQVPEPVNVVSNEEIQISNEIPVDTKLNKTSEIYNTPITITSYEATVQVVTESTPDLIAEAAANVDVTTEEEYVEGEDGEEPGQSYILKNDDEDESEEDTLTTIVDDVLDDDEDDVKSNVTKVEELKISTNVTKDDKKEPKDVVDDVIDGVADIVSDDDDEDNSKEDDKDDDDDDIFDDDDEDEEDSEEEDEEEEAEDARELTSRKSKDMRN